MTHQQHPQAAPTIAPTTTKHANCVAHDDWVGRRSTLFCINLELGGNCCGTLQPSVVACDPADDKAIGKFDERIKPPASAAWSDHAREARGAHLNDAMITSAVGFTEVWKWFVLLIEGHLANGAKKGGSAA